MQGEYPLPAPVIEKFAKTGSLLCNNVNLLHKSGIMTSTHGLRIACLGGIYDSNLYAAAESAHVRYIPSKYLCFVAEVLEGLYFPLFHFTYNREVTFKHSHYLSPGGSKLRLTRRNQSHRR